MMYRFFIFFLLYYSAIFAQEANEFKLTEDSLKIYGNIILNGNSDEEKTLANKNFLTLLEKTINNPASFEYPFDSVVMLMKLKADNNSFRLYNWNMPKSDGTFEYFGFIQTYNKKKKRIMVYKLQDKKSEMRIPENTTGDNYKWYGCLYYKLIEVTNKKNTYYTLLGWDGNDKTSNKKLIETLSFSNNGFPRFGLPVLMYEKEKKQKKRIIFEYNEMAVMSLRWEPGMNMIIFNHLSPPDSRFTGQYQYYGPDETFDGFELKKGKWIYQPAIDVRQERK